MFPAALAIALNTLPAAAMVVASVIALAGMPAGKVETEVEDFGAPPPPAPPDSYTTPRNRSSV